MATVRAQYSIGGMNCSFCAASIRKAYERTEGVEDVDVSLAHEEVLVTYDDDALSEVQVKDTLRSLGYTIRDPDREKRFREQLAELETGKRRLVISGVAAALALALMTLMVARNGWNLFVRTDARWMWYGSLALALLAMFGPGLYVKRKAWQSLRRGIYNQHVLLEACAFAGLAGGFLGWFAFPDFPVVHFFVVSTFVTTYHVLSEYTSLFVRTKASRAVRDLLDLRPETARRVDENDRVEEVPVDELSVGDRVRVKPGERIPIDGAVLEGESTVDESVATGESAPIDKVPGDDVIGGSVNRTGSLLVAVTAVGEDAFLERVVREIEEARATKPGIVQLADRVLRYFVPAVLSIAVGTALFWLLVPTVVPGTILGTGPQVRTAAFAALSVLVLGYPCALGMATPLALIRGGGEAARRGVLLRSAEAFQVLPGVDRAVLDKTGTITAGEPTVDAVVGFDGRGDRDVLRAAASAEAFSAHPIADAVLNAAEARGIEITDPDRFDGITGKGVRATVAGDAVLAGKPAWLAESGVDITGASDALERLRSRGLTTVGVAVDGELIGLIGVGDEIKPDARATVDRLRELGITPVMITGDDERTARTVADAVGVDRVLADVLPDEKRAAVRRLQDDGHRVAMIGDGINDAPALVQADVGIAIGAGTDVAIESADVVLLDDRLGGVVDAHEIGAASYRTTRQNLIAAFGFNGVGVTAATTGLVHPVFAMAAMVLSVTAVLANSFADRALTGAGVTTDSTHDRVET